MEKKFYFLIPVFALILAIPHKAEAQTVADWKILFLDVAGRTNIAGVEVYAQVNKCKNEDVVYIKIINHNEHKVTVKFFDAVLTQQHVWVKKDAPANQKSITIEPNKEVKGDCLSSNFTECIIKLKDFIDKPNDFKEYAVYHFEVIAVMK